MYKGRSQYAMTLIDSEAYRRPHALFPLSTLHPFQNEQSASMAGGSTLYK